MTSSEETVILISVVRDYDMYARCLAQNPFAKASTLHPIDNRQENAPVSVQYNRFLDAYDFGRPGWFVFCHEDFEFLGGLAPLLQQARKDCLYGPIGAWTERRLGGVLQIWRLAGQIIECAKDGTNEKIVGTSVPMGTPVETFDCQCLIVHSELIRTAGLRFDPALSFDLYVEDFCIQAKEQHGIPSLILPLACKHWSNGRVGERYHQQEEYLRTKYRTCCYTGTSSHNIGTPSIWRTCNAAAKGGFHKIARFVVGRRT